MKRAVCLPVLVLVVALLACKKKTDEEQPLPDAALPPPVAEPAPAETTAEPAPEPSASAPEPATTAAKPTTPVAKKDGGTTATDKKDAGSKPSTTVSKACLEKCNAVLQGCLVPAKKDGGFPSIGDPTKCQAAFQECQAACK